MADQTLKTDDCLDDSDEGVYEQGDGPTGAENEVDPLTPLQRIRKYAFADVFSRKSVPKHLMKIFKLADPDVLTSELPMIMEIFSKLADDDYLVRSDVLEQIPMVATLALECAQRVPPLANITSEYLLPMVVRNLGNPDNILRMIAQKTLFTLLEQGLVTKAQAEIQVCPTILALSRKEYLKEYLMHCHSDSVTLMSKLVPLLGRDVTERVFLDRFAELCSNPLFYVRKVCASHFGDFCAVVSRPCFERVLFPVYLKLCKDDVWGVRKACADVALTVSCTCSAELRRNELAPVFAQLLQDEIRWVRISAFETLGPFISTFADPTVTSLAYNSMGELVLVNSYGSEFKINSPSTPLDEVKHLICLSLDDLLEQPNIFDGTPNEKRDVFDAAEDNEQRDEPMEVDEPAPKDPVYTKLLKEWKQQNAPIEPAPQPSEEVGDADEEAKEPCDKSNENVIEPNDCDTTNDKTSTINSRIKNLIIDDVESSLQTINLSSDDSDVSVNDHVTPISVESGSTIIEGNNEDSLELYNSYNYWYVPPVLPLDPDILDDFNSTQKTDDNICQDSSSPVKAESISDALQDSPMVETTNEGMDLTFCVESEIKEYVPPIIVEIQDPPQNIVPQLLVDHFISMAIPENAQNNDDNIAYHCAYSLPAVALTLGSSNSHLLKNTVDILASNMQYKVRHTLASSLHELALIWGPDVASSNLAPIFNEFIIKDLDEVRIGVLKHLAHFLRLLNPSKRSLYLPNLAFFLEDNRVLNWRYRYELGEQLLLSVNMFTPAEAAKHISLIAHKLLNDKVAAVRQIALQLVAELLRHISIEPGLAPRLLVKFAETFAHSKKWKLRQTFVMLCAELLVSKALPIEQFASEVMPHLVDLSWDPVANVRLVVGRTIANYIITNDYFRDPENQHYDSLMTVLRRLQIDKDVDVRQSSLTDANCKGNLY